MNYKLNLFPIILCILLLITVTGCTSHNYVKNTTNFGIETAKDGYWEEARFRWEKLLEKNPDDYIALNNLGVYQEVKGNFDLAIEYYQRALEIEPKNKYIKINLDRAKAVKARFSSDEKPPENK